jgi:hypothetical protein
MISQRLSILLQLGVKALESGADATSRIILAHD